jgi:hypothetical protein
MLPIKEVPPEPAIKPPVSPETPLEGVVQATHPSSTLQTETSNVRETPQVDILAERAVSEGVTSAPEPSTTSARKSQMFADRVELDLPELPAPERKAWQKTLDEAKAKGTENAGVLADEVLAKPRALNDVETGQLVLRAQEIKNQHSQTMKEIGAATDPDVISAKRNEADALQREFDKITEATKKSGTEKGRALASQKLTINQDFDLVSVLQRAKAAKGKELTIEERSKFEGMTKQIEELQTKLAESEIKLKANQLQKEINKISRQRKRSETKAVLDDEFAALKAQFAKARIEVPRVQAAGLASLDPEGVLTTLIAKMARNRVKAGTVKAEALVDELYTAVSEHISEITKRDIRDAISGYGLESKRTRSELQKELDRLKSELYSLSSREDIEAGRRSPRSEGPRQSEINKLPRQGPSLREGTNQREGPRLSEVPLQGPRLTEAPKQGPRLSDINRLPKQGPTLQEGTGKEEGPQLGPRQGPRLSDINQLPRQGPTLREGTGKAEGPELGPRQGPQNTLPGTRKRLQSQIDELERKLREKDYAEPPKRGPIVYDRETSSLKARVESLKRKVEAEIKGKDSKREVALNLWKAGLLTGPRTHLRNIGGNLAFQVSEEVSRVPGAVADLITSAFTGRRALRGPSPVDVAKSSYEAATKGVTEAVQIMKYGATAEELKIIDRPRESNSGSKIIDAYINTVFRTLGAEDKVFRTYAFKRSILEQSKLRAKSEGKTAKELEENPTADMVSQAILDAEISTFNNQNTAAKGVEWVRQHSGPVGATAIDLVVPFRRTPANIMARLLESTPLGIPKAGGQLIKAAINKKFTFEDQRKFSQTIGRSVTGSGLIALGAWLASKGLATGLYEDDRGDREVQKASGRSPMAVKIGNAWHQIGAFSPLGNLVAIGAALYREHNRPPKEGEEPPNVAAAALPVAAKTVLDQPMLRGMSAVVDAIKEPGSRGSAFAGQLLGSAVPAIVANVGEVIDNKRRENRTIGARVQSRIPILRRNLPEQIDVFGRPLESRRTAMVDPTLTSTEKSDPFIKELVRLDVGVVPTNKKPDEDEAKHRERVIAQGKEMAKELAKLVETRGYQALSDDDKREAIKDKITQVRKAVNEFIKNGGKRGPREAREPRGARYIYASQ